MSLNEHYDEISVAPLRLPFTINNAIVVARRIDPNVVITPDESGVMITTDDPKKFIQRYRCVFIAKLDIKYKNGTLTISKIEK
jgi:hypothetical protein